MFRFIHYRFGSPPKTKGGVTFAYTVDNGVAIYAVAKCSPRDNYNKRIGREISLGRLDKGISEGVVRSVTLSGPPGKWPGQILDHYADSEEPTPLAKKVIEHVRALV